MGNKKAWESELQEMLVRAQKASEEMSGWSAKKKKTILLDIAYELEKKEAWLLTENKKDLAAAKEKNLSSALIDRLTLTPKRIHAMAEGVRSVASLKDPIGVIQSKWQRPNGLKISRVSVPLGVIFIIYESRPNVTVECAALTLKSSNAVILRGGKEAFASNHALVAIFDAVLRQRRLPTAAVNFMKITDYEAVDFLLEKEGQINLVIPRGGEGLIRKVVAQSKIPVVKHYQGICHVYVDKKANLKKALGIALNAKLERPGVCNAMETLLVHKGVASRFLPKLSLKLKKEGCEVRADEMTRKYIPWAKKAQDSDFGHEFLDKILAIRVVKDLSEAVGHIQKRGSHHTDAIVTEDKKAAQIFKQRVDSSSVMVNASTRFSDGFEYGFGAEIGISTDKIHARGPMGLEGLTSYKYIVEGKGHIRT